MHALDPILIDPDRLARWMELAHRFGPEAEPLVVEVTDFASDPVRHRLRRTADAARYVWSVVDGPIKILAEALATELEVAADA